MRRSPRLASIATKPLAFAPQVLKAFQANQGLLLAGAVAYYALLSIVPFLILMVIALSHVMNQEVLLDSLRRGLEHLVPGESTAVVLELKAFLDHGEAIGWVLLITMLFFSSLGFKVLENAISVIFLHRVKKHRRHFVVSMLLPFGYIVVIGAALFVGTIVMTQLMSIGEENLVLLGHRWSLTGFSRLLLYFAGVIGEILAISAIYYFMPVGRLSVWHSLIGGATAGVLWEIIRHALGWYFRTLSQVSVVYGSLTTAIILMFSLEVAATLLLLGAQVIAEYERVEIGVAPKEPTPMRTEATDPPRALAPGR